jgi:hypothetical protein
MTDRKKPGWAFWAIVIALLSPMLYALSVGPACWLADRDAIPELAEKPLTAFYAPLSWFVDNSETAAKAYSSYMRICFPRRDEDRPAM